MSMENDDGIRIVYDEKTGEWHEAKEPYAVIEIQTEEDYKHLKEMIEFYQKNHKEEN